MKHRIMFRGYNLKNKKWLYGYYLVNRGKSYIVYDEVVDPFAVPEDFEVAPESVGQYVGDYEGKAIFEGDMVRAAETDGYKAVYVGIVVYDTINSRFEINTRIQMGGLGGSEKIPITGEKQTDQIGMGGYYDYYFQYEVIGNEYEDKMKHPDKHILK